MTSWPVLAASSAAAAASAASSAAAKRALSLYRSLLRAARSLPAQQDRESLEEETKRRFRAEREKRAAESSRAGEGGSRSGGGGGGEGGDEGDRGGEEVALSALFDEAEARLYDARHHGIPFARLEHAAQIPRAVLESARELLRGGEEGGGVKLPRDKSARAKLEAAVERRRVKRQLEEETQDKSNND